MMIRSATIAMALAVIAAAAAAAADRPAVPAIDDTHLIGRPACARAARDTVYLLGGPDRWDGRFEGHDGQPDWHGWTSEDRTTNTDAYWHVSDFNAVNGQYSMWCGTWFGDDPGYGNAWNQNLVFTHHVADPALPAEVRLQLTLQNDTEPGYDYNYIEYNQGGVWNIWNPGGYDGVRTWAFDETVTFQPGDYVGDTGDQVQLRVRFNSDGAWSDEDGLWDTDGACQLDDITVTVDGQVIDHEDFEDQVSDRWQQVLDPGVGDFAQLILAPGHIDPCRDNDTWMVCFIDDGVVVPGTGGSSCDEFTYGPGGWVVNWTGGLLGPDHEIDNHVISPPLAVPDGFSGASLSFDAWRHQTLEPNLAAIFVVWHVRSTVSADPADLEQAGWVNDNFVYYGGPDFHRYEFMLHDQVVPGARWLQVSLGAYQIRSWWWIDRATPAPYYDNVAVKMFDFEGPSIVAVDQDLPGDRFPQQGHLDLANLASNSCRFDPVVAGGDSVAFTAQALAPDAELAGPPVMHVRVSANPLFDTVRQLPAGFTHQGGVITGTVAADTCREPDGDPIEHAWCVDLPDAGFLFPGDELHWLLAATDVRDGQEFTTLLPADTTGFATFTSPEDPAAYDPAGVVRYLPAVSDDQGTQPTTLLWIDAASTHTAWWGRRLAEAAGLTIGVDYDVFTTRIKLEDTGTVGLGQAATPELLAGYRRLIYTSGRADRSYLTADATLDGSLDLLAGWLEVGGRLLLSGDGWAGQLAGSGDGTAFLTQHAGVQVPAGVQPDLLDGQLSPRAVGLESGGVFPPERDWLVYGGCPDARRFDILDPVTAEPVAAYLNLDGQPTYSYAAAALQQNVDTGAQVISLSWDLEAVGGFQGDTGTSAATTLLRDILAWFGQSGAPVGAADLPRVLTATAYPNPFNPCTTIRLDLPRATSTRVRIYDVRGATAHTLHDGHLVAGRHEFIWRGRDDRGRDLASGVYFYEVKANGERRLGKFTLVR